MPLELVSSVVLGVKEVIMNDMESLFKKTLRSIAASVPYAASLAQWWSEIESERQAEALEQLQSDIERINNPLPSSHPDAPKLLQLLHERLTSTGQRDIEITDELRPYIEVLSLWEGQGLLEGVHAIGNRWISVYLKEPVFIMAVYDAAHGGEATQEFRNSVWEEIKRQGQGVNGEDIAATVDVPLIYVDVLFELLDAEGKGWKSNEIGISYFSPDLEVIK